MNGVIHMLNAWPDGRGQMNSFIIETPTKDLIVLDGGWKNDAAHMLDYLQHLSGKTRPRVAAWFLSHAHLDHIDCFLEIMESHPDEIEIDRVYYNFPSVQFVERTEPNFADSIRAFYRLLPRFADRAVIVSRGDVYCVGDAEFEILYTPNPAYTGNAVNNSSVVLRMHMGGKTVMFLGDLGIEAGEQILAEYGDGLQNDYCQMAHHGQNGVTRAVYEAVRPKGCLWCTPDWLWDNDLGNGFNTAQFKTVEVRGWMDELKAEIHYVMKDGDQRIRL